jgi:hypothetical protein
MLGTQGGGGLGDGEVVGMDDTATGESGEGGGGESDKRDVKGDGSVEGDSGEGNKAT